MLPIRFLGVFAASILVFACSDDPAPKNIPDAAGPDAAPDVTAPRPTIALMLEPATVTAGQAATLTATFTDFALIDPQAGPPVRPNEGHYHLYINENPNYVALWEASNQLETTPQDPPGTYSLRAVLIGSDHVELAPVVEARATLTVTAP